jgi:subtilisin-like proprotein convertase family protein
MGGATSVATSGITITNNTIGSTTAVTGGHPFTSPASTVYVKGIFVLGTTGVTITGNTIQDIISYVGVGHSGIELNANISGVVTISNNTITNVAINSTSAFRAAGILVLNSAAAYTISNNTITNMQNAASSSTLTAVGIEVNTAAPSGLIEKNKITKCYSNATGAYTANGILMSGGSNISTQNNFISDINVWSNNGVTSTSFLPSGIKITTGTGHKIYFNSINLFGAPLGGTGTNGTACLTIVGTAATGMDIRNNIFSNQFSGWPSGSVHACILMPSTLTSSYNLTLNNNAYYAPTGNFIAHLSNGTTYSVANFNPTTTTPATNFRAYSSTLNAAGTNDNASLAFTTAPLFISNTDLHLQAVGGNAALMAGAGGTGITTDIDGASRNAIPVIGAHELVLSVCTGTPSPGTVAASALAGCETFNTNLSVTGGTSGVSNLSYQWQYSPDDIVPYADIVGATNSTFTATVSATTYYRRKIICSTSGLSANTLGVQIVSNPNPSIASLPALCVGIPATLSPTISGGTWVSSTPAVATVGSSTGIVTGVSRGTATITYVLTSTGCFNTVVVTVVATPTVPVVTPAPMAVCQGGSVALSAASTYPTQSSIASGTISVTIPDNLAAGNSSGLSVALPTGAVVTAASVNFNMPTTYVGDLTINLTAPNSNTLNLFNRHGLGGDNFVNTTVSSSGGTAFASSAAPYTGTFAATAGTGDLGAAGYPVNVTTWGDLYSTPNGIWTLSARDFASGDVATLTSWTLTLEYTVPADIVWSPSATLYTDAELTTPYTGTAADTVYAVPMAPTTYTATATYLSCAASASTTISVNPLPAAIGGTLTVCEGLATTLTNADASGTWSSGDPSVATVGSTSGIVAGVLAGTATISYTFTGTGCTRTAVVTVNPTPSAISGTAAVCEGATATLTDADPGGTWSSGSTAVATVAPTGVVTGVAPGLAMITYTLPTTCLTAIEVTVNPVPSNTVSPTSATICFGETTSFTGSSSLSEFSILSQNFNTGLGAWSVTNLFGDPLSYWKVTSTPTSGATGDGTPMLDASPGDFAGTTHTILTSPAFSTIGYGSATLSFNQFLFSVASSDAIVNVEYSIDGGVTWDTVLDQYAVVSGGTTWSPSSPEVTVALPSDAMGIGNVMLRWNYYSNFGLFWDIDNISVKAAQPAATPSWAGVGGATGLSCTSCASVNITPAATGANVYEFTATTISSCATTTSVTVSVNPLPADIGGTLEVCQGLTTTLTNADGGGTWASANASVATIGSASGIATGVSAGVVNITYTLPTGCLKVAVLTVNPLPAAIGGTLQVCEGLTTTLTNTGGGTWLSGNTSVATIGSSDGIVDGIVAGTAGITYTLPTGCITSSILTVNPLPAAIGGTLDVCEGLTTTLTDATPGGTWASGTTAIATIGSSTGIATGVAAGNTNITYTLPTGCISTAVLTVNALPSAITGTPNVCVNSTTSLSSTPTGGAWTSSNPGVGSINLISGVLTGVSAGTTSVTYTLLTSCISTTTVVVNALPIVYSVTATNGGLYCIGDAGDSIILTGSELGVAYQLYNGTTPIGPMVAATGTIINFGVFPAGTYSVWGVNTSTACTRLMGSVTISTYAPATTYNVAGGGSYCSGGTGVAIGLSGSQTGYSYQLYYGPATSGAPVAGTGFALSFGLRTAAGSYTVVATNIATGCTTAMAGSATITISPVPTIYDVTGGGGYCAGGTGVSVGLGNSQNTVSYQLYNGASTVGGLVAGTGTSLNFGLQTAAGVYSVIANPGSACATVMNGTVSVSVNPLPTAYNVTGGGSYCTGGTGVHIGLSNSAAGITYQLYNGSTPVGTPVAGTGAALDFGLQTAAGTYSVSATNTTTTCTNNMAGTAAVMISASPVAYAVTGGGTYCSGGTGVNIGLANSQAGVSYQLYNGATAVGTLMTGTGAALDFGLLTAAGVYSVVANPGTSCATNMIGTVSISINASPVAYNVTGGGSYCTGGTGVHVGLSNSATGVDYQLFNGATPVGGPVAGTGTALDFGLQTMTGTYTVMGVNTVNACSTNMAGSTSVNISTSVNAYTVVGGGAYCSGGTGVNIGLSSSDAGASYQLYNGATAVGSFITGTGSAITFGPITGAGTYSVVANPGSSCATDMVGSVPVTVNALPTAYSLTGGGSYCAGGSGVNIGLANSQNTVKYQLFYGSSMLGAAVTGTGSAISFGAQTMPGTYTVMATDTVTTCVNGMAGSSSVAANIVLVPSLTVTASATTVCAGTPVTFSTAAVNAGSAPVYVWRVNGATIAGATTSSYVYAPANGDVVVGKLISNATCAIPDSATGTIVMTVNPVVTPAVTINATPGGHLCPGTVVTLNASPVATGPTPLYRWVVNGSTVGTGISYSYAPANDDIVYFMLTSNANCITPGDSIVFSNNIVMNVDSAWIPTVTIDVNPGLTIKAGVITTLTAVVANGGPTPSYQWYKSGVIIPGATNATYISNNFSNNDSVSCRVTGSGACGYTTFNSVILNVLPNGVAQATRASDIMLLPNPNKGMFIIKGSLASENDEEVYVEVIGMLGQKVYSGKTIAKNGKINEQVQLSNTLANGMYMLNIHTTTEHKVFHFVLEQ